MFDYLKPLLGQPAPTRGEAPAPAGHEQPHGNQAAAAELEASAESEGLLGWVTESLGLGAASAPEDAQAQVAEAMARVQAHQELLRPRLVEGGGGYLYRQHANGVVQIVQGPGAPTTLRPGDRGFDAVTEQIGPHPASLGLDTRALDVEQAAADGALEDAAPEVAPAPRWLDLEGLREGAEQGLAAAWEWGAGLLASDEQAPERGAEQGAERPMAEVAPEEAAPTFEDSAKGRRQAALQQLFEDYTQLEIEVLIDGKPRTVTVRARYRIAMDATERGEQLGTREQLTASNGYTYAPASPAGIAKYHGEHTERSGAYGMAKAGKASPTQLEQALQEEVDSGPLARQLAGATTEAEAQAIINEHAQRNLGIDCSGFVWRAMQSMDETTAMANTLFGRQRGTGVDADTPLGAAKSAEDLLAGGTDLTDHPEAWSTGDVLVMAGSGGDGHVVVIFDSHLDGRGVAEVTVMHSKGSDGVRKEEWTFDATRTHHWGKDRPGDTGMTNDTRVVRAAALGDGEQMA